jgi:hypothetical protein
MADFFRRKAESALQLARLVGMQWAIGKAGGDAMGNWQGWWGCNGQLARLVGMRWAIGKAGWDAMGNWQGWLGCDGQLARLVGMRWAIGKAGWDAESNGQLARLVGMRWAIGKAGGDAMAIGKAGGDAMGNWQGWLGCDGQLAIGKDKLQRGEHHEKRPPMAACSKALAEMEGVKLFNLNQPE